MKKLKKIIFYVMTILTVSAALTSTMTFRNVTREAVAIYICSLIWLTIAAIEAEKKEGAAE